MFINLDRFGLTTFKLKIIAMVTMICDHFAIAFLNGKPEQYLILRAIGRISFPIFAFVLVQGFFNTSNRLKQIVNLGMFALISEIPYDMFYGSYFDLERQNVMFTLFIGYVLMCALETIVSYNVKYPKVLVEKIGIENLNIFMELIAMVIAFAFSYFLNPSYSYGGVALILLFYVFQKNSLGRVMANILFNVGFYTNPIQAVGTLSIIPIAFYNGKPGCRKLKYMFYVFYPLHLLVLALILKYKF